VIRRLGMLSICPAYAQLKLTRASTSSCRGEDRLKVLILERSSQYVLISVSRL
jgi:hypothetical protein